MLPLPRGAGVFRARGRDSDPSTVSSAVGAPGRQVGFEAARAVERRASRSPRSSNPSSSPSRAGRARGGCPRQSRPGRSATRPRRRRPAAPHRPGRGPAGGGRSVQSMICCAHDTDTPAPASAAETCGWAASRCIQETLAAAALRVAWVCQHSHTRGDRCPSPATPPPGTVNAASTRACAAACRDSATASARRQSACRPSAHSAGFARGQELQPRVQERQRLHRIAGHQAVPGSALGDAARRGRGRKKKKTTTKTKPCGAGTGAGSWTGVPPEDAARTGTRDIRQGGSVGDGRVDTGAAAGRVGARGGSAQRARAGQAVRPGGGGGAGVS